MTIGSRPNSAIQSKNPSVFKSNPVYPVDDNLAPTDSTPRSESQQSILKTVTEILDGGTGRLKTAAHSLVLESVLATEIKVRCVFLRIGDIDTLKLLLKESLAVRAVGPVLNGTDRSVPLNVYPGGADDERLPESVVGVG
ncbi:unnamed protein product [Didymodactylos carnosus]|uniref:Uncharacterized protein n=1 Tax=Didymodactylos carnosus TaxID=1234261 RepID=A0A8S2EZI3_9BILA|nr:unnamed protein product [Didymodactylos carnosus]CAF4166699.1 unnamed protein product [Didymodactylos carnosus]